MSKSYDPTERASADDRRWFANNPKRSYRLRHAFPGETQRDPNWLSFVAVRQISPGFRVRCRLHLRGAVPTADCGEELAADLFHGRIAPDPAARAMYEAARHVAGGDA